ncbi:hypothetical protein GQ53DRAFT_786611 [Thozetella sp. PMI_491]|nr:hypothetical protein GQ53DRAFT_786611 [Thozetella sp. PMI_491]
MPEDHASHDRSLLDRLNALKPTNVVLGKGENPLASGGLPGASTGELPEPLSREDALSARLRTLRNRPGSGGPQSVPAPDSPPRGPVAATAAAAAAAAAAASPARSAASPTSPLPSAAAAEVDDIDALLAADETALDELLEGLDFDPDLAGEDGDNPLDEIDVAAEAKKVEALLRRVQGGGGDDDSEGEETDRQEAELERQDEETAEARPPDPEAGKDGSSSESPSKEDAGEGGTDALALPGVPSGLVDPPQEAEAGENPLSLPTVPSQLVDPAPEADAATRKSVDFENDITERLAALKGLGASVKTDSFGMPSAPTFQPDDRPVPGVKKRPGYTDEDQKTWCTVCLEDATIRCLGCDDDVYCARCFREMHVGPRAGYDERGHQWVKFQR